MRSIFQMALVGLVGGLLGCDSVMPVAPIGPPITESTALYMGLTLNHPAVNLSTAIGYNTVQLTATPRDAQGNPMPGLPAPTFRSSDTSTVTVTADGMVTAVKAVAEISVVATLTVGPVTHVDTALVDVYDLASPPVLDSLSVHPLVPGDTLRPMNQSFFLADILNSVGLFTPQLTARPMDADGNLIPGIRVAYASLDQDVVKVSRRAAGQWTAAKTGRWRLVAQTYAYGIEKADTVTLTQTLPRAADIFVRTDALTGQPFFQIGLAGGQFAQLAEMRVAPGAIVLWANEMLEEPVDLTFDDPTNVTEPPAVLCTFLADNLDPLTPNPDPEPFCGTGNLVMPAADLATWGVSAFLLTIRVRQFSVPGVYTYHSARLGTSGRIVVVDPNQ